MEKVIRHLIDSVINCFFILLHSAYWLMNNPYSQEWNDELIKLMNDNKFTEIDPYSATIGGKRVWIANHPYSSFIVSQNTNPFKPTSVRPRRRTIYMARKKLIHDFYD